MSQQNSQQQPSYLPKKRRGFQGSPVIRESVAAGLQTGAVGAVASAGAVLAAHMTSPAFQSRVNFMGKAAIIGGTAFVAMMLRSESMLPYCFDHPEVCNRPKSKRNFVDRASLDLAEVFVDRPLRVVGVLGATAVGTVAWRMFQDRASSTSVKVLHTRVVGQASVVALLLATMAANNWTLHAEKKLKRLEEERAEQQAGAAAAE